MPQRRAKVQSPPGNPHDFRRGVDAGGGAPPTAPPRRPPDLALPTAEMALPAGDP